MLPDLLQISLTYFVVHKTGHYIVGDKFVKCEPFFTIFVLLGRE